VNGFLMEKGYIL